MNKKTENKITTDADRLHRDIQNLEKREQELHRVEEEFKNLITAFREAGFSRFIRYIQSKKHIIWSNLLAGMFQGLGILIGMTVIFALLIWAVGKFVDFPLIGQYFEKLQSILDTTYNQAVLNTK